MIRLGYGKMTYLGNGEIDVKYLKFLPSIHKFSSISAKPGRLPKKHHGTYKKFGFIASGSGITPIF